MQLRQAFTALRSHNKLTIALRLFTIFSVLLAVSRFVIDWHPPTERAPVTSVLLPLTWNDKRTSNSTSNIRVPMMKRMNYYRVKPLLRQIRCGKYVCMEESGARNISGADLVVFADTDISRWRQPPKRNPNVLWAFTAKEPQMKMLTNTSRWDGLFNYTATFDSDTDGNSYIFRYKIWRLASMSHTNFAHQRKALAGRVLWFVSHCTTSDYQKGLTSGREAYVRELSKYITVDIYTKSGNCKHQLKGLVRNNKVEAKLNDYPFYLSFENSLCKDYITEKLWKVLEANVTTIPVALGGLSLQEYTNVAPPNSFIHVKNFTSPQALAKYLKFVASNDDAFNYYLQWRNEYYLTNTRGHYTNVGDYICHFCQLAHDRPHRIWETMSKDYGQHKCLDIAKPQAHCSYYNLSCSNSPGS